ncbi:hypothetical protein ABTH29_20775, partial [Acinetobacter baumannii]
DLLRHRARRMAAQARPLHRRHRDPPGPGMGRPGGVLRRSGRQCRRLSGRRRGRPPADAGPQRERRDAPDGSR